MLILVIKQLWQEQQQPYCFIRLGNLSSMKDLGKELAVAAQQGDMVAHIF